MSMGDTIVKLRIEKEMRQADLANQVGVHPSNVTRWELGLSKPRKKALEKLAVALGTTVEELLSEDTEGLRERLMVQDSELAQMLLQVHRLEEKEQEALKIFLDALLTRTQMSELMKRGAAPISGSENIGKRRFRPKKALIS